MKSTIISRYLFKEAGMTTLAVAAVLVGVLFTNSLIRLLSRAADGNLPASGVMSMLGLFTVGYISFVLPAAVLLGIVLTFGRLYRDSEMPALSAAGVGPWQLLGALTWLVVPIALLVAWLSLSAAPWASLTAANLQAELQQSVELEGVRPGRFLTSAQAKGVLYVEDMADDGELRGVFLQTERDAETVLVTAATARRRIDPVTGEDFLVLRDGYRLEGIPGERRWRLLEFEEHGIRLREAPLPEVRIKQRSVPTAELLRRWRPADQAELQLRLSAPLMVLVLAVLAIPVSKASPREGRYGKLLIAVFLFVVYFNLLNLSAEWLSDKRLPPWVGLWWVHALMAGIGLVWLRRSFGLRRRRRA